MELMQPIEIRFINNILPNLHFFQLALILLSLMSNNGKIARGNDSPARPAVKRPPSFLYCENIVGCWANRTPEKCRKGLGNAGLGCMYCS